MHDCTILKKEMCGNVILTFYPGVKIPSSVTVY